MFVSRKAAWEVLDSVIAVVVEQEWQQMDCFILRSTISTWLSQISLTNTRFFRRCTHQRAIDSKVCVCSAKTFTVNSYFY